MHLARIRAARMMHSARDRAARIRAERIHSARIRTARVMHSARIRAQVIRAPYPTTKRHSRAAASLALDGLKASVRLQRIGNAHRTVGALMILQNGNHRPRGGNCRAIEHIRKARRAGAVDSFGLQTARLIVGAVGGAGHLPPTAATAIVLLFARHPRLDIELAVRRRAQVSATDIEHPKRHLQPDKDIALQIEQLLMEAPRRPPADRR